MLQVGDHDGIVFEIYQRRYRKGEFTEWTPCAVIGGIVTGNQDAFESIKARVAKALETAKWDKVQVAKRKCQLAMRAEIKRIHEHESHKS